jgi:pimeloyl-ACP methyl ester carboxylesterase
VSKLELLGKALRELGWQVMIPELPYFDAPEPDKPWTVDDFGEYILAEAKKKFNGKPFVWFGHSHGGRIGLKVTSGQTEAVKGLVACAAAGISRDASLKRQVFGLAAQLMAPLKSTPVYPLCRKLLYKLARNHDYEQITSENKQQTFRLVIEEDVKPFIGKVKVPTLILWGDQDRLTPVKDAQLLHERIKDSQMKIYPDQGHRLPYKLPTQLAKEIDDWWMTIN